MRDLTVLIPQFAFYGLDQALGGIFHHIQDDIETMAEEEARSKGISLNKAFLSLLRKGAGTYPIGDFSPRSENVTPP